MSTFKKTNLLSKFYRKIATAQIHLQSERQRVVERGGGGEKAGQVKKTFTVQKPALLSVFYWTLVWKKTINLFLKNLMTL